VREIVKRETIEISIGVSFKRVPRWPQREHAESTVVMPVGRGRQEGGVVPRDGSL